MPNPIMNNFSPDGTTTYEVQDARVDTLQSSFNGLKTKNGFYNDYQIEYPSVSLTKYDGGTEDLIYYYDVSDLLTPEGKYQKNYLEGGGNCTLHIAGVTKMSDVTVDDFSINEYVVSGHFENGQFVPDNNASLSNHFIDILLGDGEDPDTWEFDFYMDNTAVDELDITSITIDTYNSEPQKWSVDVIPVGNVIDEILDVPSSGMITDNQYFFNLYDAICQQLEADGYITLS